MATTANNLLAEVDKKVFASFQAGADSYKTVYQDVFNIMVPERKDEQFSILTLNNAVTEVADGGSYSKSEINDVAINGISMKLFKDSVQLSDFSSMFDNYGSIQKAAMSKGKQFQYKIDSMAAAFIDNCTSTTAPYAFTIGGVTTALVGDAQTIGISGLTQDNKVTGALTKDTLNTAYTYLKKQKGHDGNIAGYQARRLLVPQEEQLNSWQITTSKGEPESAFRNDNFTQTLGLDLIVWPLLSSATGCLLMSEKGENGARGLVCVVKKMPSVKRVVSQDTGCIEYQIDMAINFGFVDYLGVVGIGF